MTSVKKVKVALLALVAALVIAIPTSAFAVNLGVSTASKDAEYVAYQLFEAGVDGSTLVDVKWGAGVDGDAVIAALKAYNSDAFKDVKTASDVAKAIEGLDLTSSTKGARTDADALAIVLADVLKDGNATAIPLELVQGTEYTHRVAVDSGYYLVEQTAAGKVGDTTGGITKYILATVADTDVIVNEKADVPSSDKGVDEDDDNPDAGYGKSADYEIGQKIPYQLTATLPANYGDYTSYYLAFNDKATEGLDYVVDGDGKVIVTITSDAGDTITASAIEMKTITDDGKYDKGFVISIDDLKTAAPNATAGSKIIVRYQAVLNNNAVIGNAGNPNKSNITFSNNPNNSGKGKPTGNTPEDYAIVFTYELDNTKTGEGDDVNGLKDAKFVLVNKTGDANDGKIAKVVAGKFVEWVADTAENRTANALTSDAEGKFNVTGLDTGAYQLIETEAPDGYNLLQDPISFVISSTIEKQAGDTMEKITKLQITVGNHDPKDGNVDTGTVAQEIQNTKGSVLPSTGGIGTTIFYIVGIGLILAAAITLVVRRRNATTA